MSGKPSFFTQAKLVGLPITVGSSRGRAVVTFSSGGTQATRQREWVFLSKCSSDWRRLRTCIFWFFLRVSVLRFGKGILSLLEGPTVVALAAPVTPVVVFLGCRLLLNCWGHHGHVHASATHSCHTCWLQRTTLRGKRGGSKTQSFLFSLG